MLWQTDFVSDSSPIVDGNRGYVPFYEDSRRGIRAINLHGGSTVWTHYLENAPQPPILFRNGIVLAAGHVIHRLNAAGDSRWTKQVESDIVAAPTPFDDGVVCGDVYGTVYNIAPDGTIRWTFDANPNDLSIHDDVKLINARLGISNGTVLVPGPQVFALNLSTGEERWRKDVGFEPMMAPSIVGKTVILGANKELVALDIESGDVQWRFKPSAEFEADAKPRIGPACTRDGIFIGTADGSFYRIDPESGSEQWQTTLPSPMISPPVATKNSVIVGRFVALDQSSGELLWKREPSTRKVATVNSMIVAGDRLYTADHYFTAWGISNSIL
jgi:outer membrane protein assembly factor BamB